MNDFLISTQFQVGDRIPVRAFKADGVCYRRWSGFVEEISGERLLIKTPLGHRVDGEDGRWESGFAIRGYYWPGKWYSVLEVYNRSGQLVEIYLNINSPARVTGDGLRFVDYELDVSRQLPGPAQIVDQDEFQQAAERYGYSRSFQRKCLRIARRGVEIVEHWSAGEAPVFPGEGGGTL